MDKKRDNKSFWNRYAKFYDSEVLRFSRAAYADMYRLMTKVLTKEMDVLELATGTGLIAINIAGAVRSITATDFSPKMIETAKKKIVPENVRFSVEDATALSFDDNSFDVVIANHMLYHVPDVERALREIARVLKPGGSFYATTIGYSNMRELADLLRGFDDRIDFAQDSIAEAFGLESGKEILERFFASVDVRRYKDSLHITEPKPLIDYVLSLSGIGNILEIIQGEKIKQFENYILELFQKHVYIDITKDAGIFISTGHVN